MAKELNEDTGFNVSVKTLIAIGFAMATIIGTGIENGMISSLELIT